MKKYTILIIASIIIVKLLVITIITIWPDLLTTKLPNGGILTLSTGVLEAGIEFVINVVFIFLLTKEMKKEKILSIPILVMTFFSNLIGVLFFFLILAENKLKYKKLDS
ncbi:MAG: hypothetical protein GX259_03325 [Bacteroidales bacterium]|nr:hypothetical protein [Bacteroidales bacterium]